jgi:F-type H+-transporting ATPase subunit delta
MTLSVVATRYANALADVVTARGSSLAPEAALAELRAFESALRESPELRAALETPAVSASRKKAVVGRIVDILKLSTVARNFLFVLIDHRRTHLFGEIVHAFQASLDERTGLLPAEIASASEMNEAERAALAAELEKLTGKRIRMKYTVDRSLIGGVVAKVGSTLYDGSVRGSLESLQRRLSAEG